MRTKRLSGRSIRTRVITAVIGLSALALLLAGLVIYTHSNAVIDARAVTSLDRAVEEVTTVATQADPGTGQPYANIEALLKEIMRRSTLETHEGAFAIVNGKLRWESPVGVGVRPENDPEFVELALSLANNAEVTTGHIVTALNDYQFIVIPVRGAEANSTESGALVRTVDMRGERADIVEVYKSYALVAIGALLLVAILIWMLVSRLLEPIAWVSQTARQITEHDLSQRIPVRGQDDLSDLTNTVNEMLDRVENAVNSQRQLLDDVGHELRTPLTIVRGNLELMDASDPTDVQSSRDLAIDELDRMRRLVDDLLVLAKAEQTDFVTPQPTDIARLTDETLVKATKLGQRHWVLDNMADVTAILDPQRITQAWLQLAANAVQYSPNGSTVGMGSRVQGNELILWVRDEGIGMSAADRERAQERWVRGEHGRGFGLGLAIVSTIAAAHQGRVEIESVKDIGSRISIVLALKLESATTNDQPAVTDDPESAPLQHDSGEPFDQLAGNDGAKTDPLQYDSGDPSGLPAITNNIEQNCTADTSLNRTNKDES